MWKKEEMQPPTPTPRMDPTPAPERPASVSHSQTHSHTSSADALEAEMPRDAAATTPAIETRNIRPTEGISATLPPAKLQWTRS